MERAIPRPPTLLPLIHGALKVMGAEDQEEVAASQPATPHLHFLSSRERELRDAAVAFQLTRRDAGGVSGGRGNGAIYFGLARSPSSSLPPPFPFTCSPACFFTIRGAGHSIFRLAVVETYARNLLEFRMTKLPRKRALSHCQNFGAVSNPSWRHPRRSSLEPQPQTLFGFTAASRRAHASYANTYPERVA